MATREEQVKELQDKIRTLSSLGPAEQELAAKYQIELEALLAEAPAPTKTTGKEVKVKTMGDEQIFDTGLTPEDYQGAGTGISKRPSPGDHEAEMGLPEDYSQKAYKFPFTIVEKGPWAGFDGDAFYPTKQPFKDASTGRVFAPIKNLALACGVEEKVVNGKVTFNLADFAGKRFLAVYVEEPYEFETERGTFSGTQSKVKRAKPMGEKVEEAI